MQLYKRAGKYLLYVIIPYTDYNESFRGLVCLLYMHNLIMMNVFSPNQSQA